MSLNRVILQGRIGSAPELKSTNSGKEVCSVNLAVDRDYKNSNGERQTDWFTIVAFGESAKFLSRYFTKGSTAIVEGRLQMREWTDRDGNKRKSAEIVADHVYFGGSKKDDTYGGSAPDYAAPPAATQGFAEIKEEDGELPF